ncbi:glycosyltransferase family 1 protein [Chlorobaculum sp. 24CR]|uniref:glycosyltransferase n=1 Tax=Chlorobaculum sp. 24CR TaxID=2508878 RepID=UPI00100BBD10|nr:glycosyltransferase [Chlorobaculum sp. 24CR]RXK85021.1 glycosyltransferase family 1 protein [Chlorobaculum sp. 24CR]
MQKPALTIIPSVPVWKKGEALCFDRKFYDGIVLYTQLWPGPVSCVMASSDSPLESFGVVEATPASMPFNCIVLKKNEIAGKEHIRSATIVMASADAFDQLHIAALCRQMGVKCVYVIEYIPETRYQIVALDTHNPAVRLRQNLYLWLNERKRVKAFELCDGLQCNGAPAFSEYREIPNRLLYFDTRVSKEQIIGDDELETRLAALKNKQPLRLAFSGRLIAMKGADHLVQLAVKLKKLNLRFLLSIYGTGDREEEMKRFIERNDLGGEVVMRGAVDFHRQLLPELKEKVDLFVALHRQSDPSCTYLETLSCGVPIVGYRNRAFGGILDLADVGWGVKPDDLDAVAWMILRLDLGRGEIAGKSRNAAGFGRKHDFETTYKNRISHLLSTINGERRP